MQQLLQSTAATVVGRGYLAADHLSTATGLDPAITISKNGGNFANPDAGASVMTEIEATGWYKFALGTADTGTLGPLIIRGTHATMDNIEVVFQVVAVPLTTVLTESYAAHEAAATPAQLLYMILSLLAEKSVSGTTVTAKKLDGSTTAMTLTLNDGANPTSVTRAT